MTVRGGGVPTCFLGFHAARENGSAASELRCRCAWLHHGSGPWTHRIQGCGAIDPRPKAGSPPIVIPIAPSVPSCSKLSRCGLARAEHAARLVRRPTLTAPARAGLSEPRVGTKKRAFRSNKETDEGKKMPLANSLTKKPHTRKSRWVWHGGAAVAMGIWGGRSCCRGALTASGKRDEGAELGGRAIGRGALCGADGSTRRKIARAVDGEHDHRRSRAGEAE